MVEALSAEDIGKLPDTTIAESLARLPGLTTQRDAKGNATNINVRGFGPDFSGYTLNGREQTSTTNSRAIDLSVYPAELIAGATVYKTADASLMAAGLAGVIDQKLIDPLAFGSRTIAGSVTATRTGEGLPVTGSGTRYSLSYIDQFADRKLGLALGYVHSDSTSNGLASGSWGSNVNVTDTSGVTHANVAVPFAGGLSYENDHFKDTRDGLAAIVNYKANSFYSTELDLYYAKIKTSAKKAMVKRASPSGAITDATIDANGVVQSGTYTMAAGSWIADSEYIYDDDTLKSIGWKNSFNLSDRWKATLDLSHNSAVRNEKDVEAYGLVTSSDTMSFTNGGATVPHFSYGNAAMYTDPAQVMLGDTGWSGINGVAQDGYLKGPTITDKLNALRLDFKRTLDEGLPFTDLQFGANYAKRTKDYATDEGLLVPSDGNPATRVTIPGAYVEHNVGGSGLDMLTFDPTAALWPGIKLQHKYNNDILSKTWNVQEAVTTAYGKLNIDTSVAGLPVRGNVGLQFVHTEQSSGGYRADIDSNVVLNNPAGAITTAGTSYDDVLPSLNLTADVGHGTLVRLSAGVEMARPYMTDMRNSLSAAVDTNQQDASYGRIVGSAGNPYLKPFKADALDLSVEKYFGKKAYVSAAAFYKKLDTYILPAINSNYDFTQVAQQIGLSIPAAGPIGVFTQTVNGSGGSVKGIELTASMPLNLAAQVLDGFGVGSSLSNVVSSVQLPNLIGQNPTQGPVSGPAMSLPGLSHLNAKLMLYYEKSGFSAFVADNYRSKYVGYVDSATVGGYPSPIYIAPQIWVSAQVGYEIQSGTFKGLSLRLEGNNLNKPVYKELKADGSINSTTSTGASYGLRLAYKFQ